MAVDLLSDLNEPQRQAVCHVDGPLLVLAGAGSGKTRVITRRVAYLVDQGVAPWQVMAITFTNKAAEEMRQRVEALQTPRGAMVCTFHSLCARLLREFGPEAGLGGNYSIYDRDDQLKVAKQAIEDVQPVSGGYLTPAKILGIISNAKNDLVTAQQFASQGGPRRQQDLGDLYMRYEQLLAANNAVDFDDLLLRMAFLLRDNAEVRRTLSERFRYILIDEYQDTNHAQYLIAHAIAHGHENICATGDPDQSIYGWRGANIRNIMEFEHDYPNATVVRLEENYRSVQPILTAASTLIARNEMRKDKSLFTRKVGGEDVAVLTVDNEHAEAEQVALRIADLRAGGMAYGDMAVFYRVNSLSRVLEEALMRKGIAYCIARGTEFYGRKEIKDVLAYVKLLVNPDDNISLLRIINTPTRGIGKTTVERLASFAFAANLNLLPALESIDRAEMPDNAKRKLRIFREIMGDLRELRDQPVRTILEAVYRESGLEDALGKADEDSRQAHANVEELISSAAEFDELEHEDSLAEFLHQVALVSDVDRLEGSDGAVTLMTLHAAKGLEFPAVFMVGCEEGLLPFERELLPGQEPDPEKLEEERRLMFVGMTRAQQRLTLLSARRRMIRGQTLPQAASRFLDEIGDESIHRSDLTTEQPAPSPRFSRGGFFSGAARPDQERRVIESMSFDDVSQDYGDVYETPMPEEYQYLRKGCTVRHARYGRGKVVRISQSWPDTRVEVHFPEYGPKKLVLNKTSLEVELPEF